MICPGARAAIVFRGSRGPRLLLQVREFLVQLRPVLRWRFLRRPACRLNSLDQRTGQRWIRQPDIHTGAWLLLLPCRALAVIDSTQDFAASLLGAGFAERGLVLWIRHQILRRRLGFLSDTRRHIRPSRAMRLDPCAKSGTALFNPRKKLRGCGSCARYRAGQDPAEDMASVRRRSMLDISYAGERIGRAGRWSRRRNIAGNALSGLPLPSSVAVNRMAPADRRWRVPL
jgi:hypothetical protein